jgi:ATP-dependent DNA ligase
MDTLAHQRVAHAWSTAKLSFVTTRDFRVFDLIRFGHYDHVASLCAFYLLELDGEDLRDWPLEERKAALEKLPRKTHPGISLAAKASFQAGGLQLLRRSIGGLDQGQKSGSTCGSARI